LARGTFRIDGNPAGTATRDLLWLLSRQNADWMLLGEVHSVEILISVPSLNL
jgi:hypothetical protein